MRWLDVFPDLRMDVAFLQLELCDAPCERQGLLRSWRLMLALPMQRRELFRFCWIPRTGSLHVFPATASSGREAIQAMDSDCSRAPTRNRPSQRRGVGAWRGVGMWRGAERAAHTVSPITTTGHGRVQRVSNEWLALWCGGEPAYRHRLPVPRWRFRATAWVANSTLRPRAPAVY